MTKVNRTPRLFWLSCGLLAFCIALYIVLISEVFHSAAENTDIALADSVAQAAEWLAFLLMAILMLLTVYLGFSVALGADVELEWQRWPTKRDYFQDMVDDMAVDEDFGQFSAPAHLHIAQLVIYLQRGTIRSWFDGKRLAKQLAQERGLLEQYKVMRKAPNLLNWTQRYTNWQARAVQRFRSSTR